MAKVFYVVERADDYVQANFFKTEKEALAYGISEFPDFDMFDEPMEDEDNGGWYTGDKLEFKEGVLFMFHEADWSIEAIDEAAAREEVGETENFGAIYFDGFKKGTYGYLGNGADGKGYKWSADDDGISESEKTKIEYKMKNIKTFEAFTDERAATEATTETVTEAVNPSGYIKAGKLGYNDQFLGRQSLSMTLSLDLGFNKKDQYGGGNFIGFDHVSMYGTGKEGVIIDDALTGKYTYDELKAAAAEHFGL